MTGDIQGHEIRLREPQHSHKFVMCCLGCARVFYNNIGLATEQIFRRRLHAALFLTGHGMAGDIVNIRRQDGLQMFPDILLRTARIRKNRAFF